MNIRALLIRFGGILLLFQIWTSMAHADASYIGASEATVMPAPGCNSTAFVQVPGSADLLIGRQMLTSEGQLPDLANPGGCSGGKGNNGWALVLYRLDWKTHTIKAVKPVLDTSIDPRTHESHARISGGPMQGALIHSAYDASMVTTRGGRVLVAFECVLAQDRFGVTGTSSCVGTFDVVHQEVDLAHTQVVISGVHAGPHFYAATVPELLAYQDRLFLYWSALTIDSGKFVSVTARGAELELSEGTVSVKGSRGRVVHSTDEPLTVSVWRPDSSDPMSNNTVDIRALWVNGKSVVAMASVGGAGCAAPSDASKGCYRLVVVKSESPLGDGVFNHAHKVNDAELPTNAQEYTRPIRDPDGHYWFIGHYLRPHEDGFSETRPAPGKDVWQKIKAPAVLVMFPITDRSLWPSE